MWSYFWKLLFGGPQENAASIPPTTTNSDSISSAEKEPLQLGRLERDITDSKTSSSSTIDSQKEFTEEFPGRPKTSLDTNVETNSEKNEARSTQESEAKDEDFKTAVDTGLDWQALYQKIEHVRKDGYLDRAEVMFESAIADKAPIEVYSEGLFKIWRLQNKDDLRAEKFEIVQERVLKMLDLYAPGLKITDARSLFKAAEVLGNEEIKDKALKVINVVESTK
jgi:hypothetical protein